MTLALPVTDTRQLIPLRDAVGATANSSVSAFRRWCTKWRVAHFRQGLYLRSELADALVREEAARKRRAKK